jgi:hypothetical protein
MKRFAFALALLAPAALRAEDIPLSFSEFSIARIRIEKKITADAEVTNAGKDPVTGLTAVMVAFEGDREVGRSRAVEIDILGGGEKRGITFEIVKCPFFTNYVVETTYFSAGQEARTRFLGRDLFNPPAAERKDAIKGTSYVEVFGMKFERADTAVKVTLKARNLGELTSTLARIRFKFYDNDNALVKEAVCDFAETFAFGKEVPLSVNVADVPDFTHARADIVETSADERRLPEGEFTGEAAVEAAGFRFEVRSDGSMRVTGRVRNGLRVPVRNLVIRIMLFRGSDPVKELLLTPDRTPGPSEIAPFSSLMKSPPEFDDYRYESAYEEAEDVAVGPEPGPGPDPKEPDPAPDPEPDPKESPKPPKEEPKIRSAAQMIELTGATWLEGDWIGEGKQSKWFDSILLIGMRLTDKNANQDRVQQGGTLEFVFKAPGKKDVVGRVKIEKFAWSRDARKFAVNNIKPGQDAGYDPDTKSVKIPLVRVPERDAWNYSVDFKFTSTEGDVWEWKGLTEPYSAAAMKPTGKKK